MPTPSQPKVYHIVHVDNLASVVGDGCLWPDATMVNRQGVARIGMTAIKQRRLALPVRCHQGLCVGECVPFYFCSRSVMLYVIHRANHEALSYRGGQGPIVHLEADLHRVIAWARSSGTRWAFSLSNAGSRYAQFRTGTEALEELDWKAIAATDFRDQDVQEAKQAEFLVEGSCPWHLVERIGVHTRGVAQRAAEAMTGAAHRPRVEIRRDWYY